MKDGVRVTGDVEGRLEKSIKQWMEQKFYPAQLFTSKVTKLTTEVLYSKVVARKLILCANIT